MPYSTISLNELLVHKLFMRNKQNATTERQRWNNKIKVHEDMSEY